MAVENGETNGHAQASASSSPRASPSSQSIAHTTILNGPQLVDHDAIPAHFAPVSLRLVLTGWALGVLLGVALVLAGPILSPRKVLSILTPTGSLVQNATAAATAGMEASTQSAWWAAITAPQLHLYLAAWSLFHLLEFLVTARWNPTRLMKDSFLLQNGRSYHAAHIGGLVEFLLEATFLAQQSSPLTTVSRFTYAGLALVLLGQYLRSTAMIHASSNFSHQVAHKKRHDHILVTTGVYAWVRHPSYTGFYLWALGTQVLLANPFSVAVFAAVLWRFFDARIRSEEVSLINFFGEEYRAYKREVRSGIPFVA